MIRSTALLALTLFISSVSRSGSSAEFSLPGLPMAPSANSGGAPMPSYASSPLPGPQPDYGFRNLVPTQTVEFSGKGGGDTKNTDDFSKAVRGLQISVTHGWGNETLTVEQKSDEKPPKFEIFREESNGNTFGPETLSLGMYNAALMDSEKDIAELRKFSRTYKTDCASGKIAFRDPDHGFRTFFCSGDTDLTPEEQTANRIILRFSRYLAH